MLKILVYAIIFIALVTLSRLDYNLLPAIESYSYLIASVALLFLGVFLQPLAWLIALRSIGVRIPYDFSAFSIGISILGKYLPGKVWAIVGRAGVVSKATDVGIKKLSLVSLFAQAVVVLSGTLFLPFYYYDWLSALLMSLAVILFAVACVIAARHLIGALVVELRALALILLLYLFIWLLWGVGFLFLVRAISTSSYDWVLLTVFPSSASLSILALFSPGGLGVREAFIAIGLNTAAVDSVVIPQLVVASRVWFLFGELAIFFFALYRLKSYTLR